MNYRNLEIWQLARELVITIHEMTLTKLPKFDEITNGLEKLGRNLNLFLQSIERAHISGK